MSGLRDPSLPVVLLHASIELLAGPRVASHQYRRAVSARRAQVQPQHPAPQVRDLARACDRFHPAKPAPQRAEALQRRPRQLPCRVEPPVFAHSDRSVPPRLVLRVVLRSRRRGHLQDKVWRLVFLPYLERIAVCVGIDHPKHHLHIRLQPRPVVSALVVHHQFHGHEHVVVVAEMVVQRRRGQPDSFPMPEARRGPKPVRVLDRIGLLCRHFGDWRSRRGEFCRARSRLRHSRPRFAQAPLLHSIQPPLQVSTRCNGDTSVTRGTAVPARAGGGPPNLTESSTLHRVRESGGWRWLRCTARDRR